MTWRPDGSTRWRRQARPVGRQLKRCTAKKLIRQKCPPASHTPPGSGSVQFFAVIRHSIEKRSDLTIEEIDSDGIPPPAAACPVIVPGEIVINPHIFIGLRGQLRLEFWIEQILGAGRDNCLGLD